ncbi:MAG: hypothetical protein A3A88_09590 [Nitrospirae bacterium RIFCSPLOWO2_01_FULL_62_17]|nr:MAG: hypothetical protein A3A88_09590 [Nitrospirae bacterium RIFCSPLOWO2_01_FULL_62_17]
MPMTVTQNREIRSAVRRLGQALLLAAAVVALDDPARAQSVSGVRGFSGGTAALFSLTGPGNLYVDSQGGQGYMYNFGNNFESFNFRLVNGQAYSGGMMTLGPQLTIGLIQGANQVGSPTIFPPAPRLVAPLPSIQSSIFDDFQPLIDIP